MLGIQCTELILYIWLQEKTVCVQRGTLTVVSIAQMISSPQKWLVQHRFPSLQDTKLRLNLKVVESDLFPVLDSCLLL